MRKLPLLGSLSLLLGLVGGSAAADLPQVTQVELQPLAALVQRLVESLDHLGAPLPQADRRALRCKSIPREAPPRRSVVAANLSIAQKILSR